MKASQRYRLNRLAEQLVTVRRFGTPFQQMWNDGTVLVFDEFDAVSPWLSEQMDAANPGLADKLDAIVGCPEGNPECPNPDVPVGYGYHAFCFKPSPRRQAEDAWLNEVGLKREDFNHGEPELLAATDLPQDVWNPEDYDAGNWHRESRA